MFKKQIKYISLFLVSALALVSLNGCSKKEELEKVRLNEVVHSIFYAPQYVAMELGFFEEEGLLIELSVGQGADKTMTALISNAADIGLMGMEAAIYVYNEGKEDYALTFAQLTQRAGNFLVSREDEKDFKWENLRGTTVIGGRIGGMPELVLEYVLRQHGMTPFTDVDITNNLQFTSTSGAFVGGVGDYTVEFDPSAYAIEQAGSGYVVASLGLESGKLPYTVYMTTQSYIDSKPETVQKFTNAIYKGQQWVENHSSQEIAKVIAPHFTESSLDDLEFMVERYKSQDTWKDNPTLNPDDFALFQDIMEQGGELSQRVPFSDLITNDFAEKTIN